MSVIPALQRTGIETRLIEAGIEELKRRDARGIVLLGDPDYYRRFGFEHDPAMRYSGPPPQFFQRRILSGDAPLGTVSDAPTFV